MLVQWASGVFYFGCSLLALVLFEIKASVIVLPVHQSRPLTSTSHPKGKGLREGECKSVRGEISRSRQCSAVHGWGRALLRDPVVHLSKPCAS